MQVWVEMHGDDEGQGLNGRQPLAAAGWLGDRKYYYATRKPILDELQQLTDAGLTWQDAVQQTERLYASEGCSSLKQFRKAAAGAGEVKGCLLLVIRCSQKHSCSQKQPRRTHALHHLFA